MRTYLVTNLKASQNVLQEEVGNHPTHLEFPLATTRSTPTVDQAFYSLVTTATLAPPQSLNALRNLFPLEGPEDNSVESLLDDFSSVDFSRVYIATT